MKIDVWDYTHHADSYLSRPNYADAAIDELCRMVGARPDPGWVVVDVGAGTANLTLMLLQRGLHCIAVEPNDAMRAHGVKRTAGMAVTWREATGLATGLPDASANWVTFGSSFNTMDRDQALVETARVLKPGGHFTCMWNHRDLDDPVQQETEALIRRLAPGYSGGTRREDQTEVIARSPLFEKVQFTEASQSVARTPEQYVDAWRSTRNLAIHAGDRFEEVLAAIAAQVGKLPEIRMTYTTRAWTARVRK